MTEAIQNIENTAPKPVDPSAIEIRGFKSELAGSALVNILSSVAGQWVNSENRVTGSAKLATSYNNLVVNLSNKKQAMTKDYLEQIIALQKSMPSPSNKAAYAANQAKQQVLNQEMSQSKSFFSSELSAEQSVSSRATSSFSNDMAGLNTLFDAMKTVESKTVGTSLTLMETLQQIKT
ncbi:MAG: hypothetical protein CME32_05645 [Gimesia sp.]|nr:hypothetical protein [Gimesia sp.]